MKKSLIIFLLSILFFSTPLHMVNASDIENTNNNTNDTFKHLQAIAWKEEVKLLIENKKWYELQAIEHIGMTHFKNEKIWDKEFKNIWGKYQIQKSINSWDKSKTNKSVWKLSMNKKDEKPDYSIGLSMQNNIPVIMFTNLNDGWACIDRCNITITNITDNESFFLSARPSLLDANQRNVNMLGSPLPLNRIKNSHQVWEVIFPDGKDARFDVSFLPSVCNYYLNSCVQ